MAINATSLWQRLPDSVRRKVYRVRVRRGHFYSPYPDLAEVEQRADTVFAPRESFPGIEMGEDAQLALCDLFVKRFPALPFRAGIELGVRYRYNNRPYQWGDGMFLALVLDHLKPQRYLEIGSGWSTLCALDTRDHLLDGNLEITTCDPYPDHLLELLGGVVPEGLTLERTAAQDLDLALVDRLESGDVLFIDSTHVAKPGSDVPHLVFEVLPRVAPGVWIHIHDIFGNFEYPREWVFQGRVWNEAYLMRAFLQFNADFEVALFPPWLVPRHRDWFADHLPPADKNPGGSLWLRRRTPDSSPRNEAPTP